MKSLTEKTTGELWTLKAELEQIIGTLIRTGRPTSEVVRFRNAVDNELDRRGA